MKNNSLNYLTDQLDPERELIRLKYKEIWELQTIADDENKSELDRSSALRKQVELLNEVTKLVSKIKGEHHVE